jgi:hypothetical protein
MWDLEEEKTSKEREYFSLYKGFRVISPRLKKRENWQRLFGFSASRRGLKINGE